ncbi:MAG: carbon monoxide dehydrogenase subunit G [Hyphomonadaceae bacterium]|nr:carbon monoxide dehydrogenase subunit G [Hyphomonadaceae bacterium]
MDFKGRYEIAGSPQAVWEALHDADVLKECITGAETVTRVSPTAYAARVALKIGPVQARFDGKVDWLDEQPPEGYAYAGTLKGEGQGGAAGFARGEARVLLKQEGARAVLTYEAKATIGGKLAQVGQRLVDSVAKSQADDFFSKFAAHVGSAPVAGPPASTPAKAAAPSWIWIAAAAVAALLVVLALALR